MDKIRGHLGTCVLENNLLSEQTSCQWLKLQTGFGLLNDIKTWVVKLLRG
jgi:hypothetical protein